MAGSFIRDTLLLDASFFNLIMQGIRNDGLPAGSTIVVAARDLKFGLDAQGAGFRLSVPGYNLVVLADALDMRGGAIDQSGSQGANGATGQPGAGYPPALNGSPGSNGGAGNDGTPGANVRVYCRQLVNVTIISDGGVGGDGGWGGGGGGGAPGDPGHVGDPNATYYDPDIPPSPGGDGGDGADGGPGGNGGSSGQIWVTFVEDLSGGFDPAARVSHAPGAAGNGGHPGLGGPGGLDARSGADGAWGAAGNGGQDQAPLVRQVDAATLFAQIINDFGTAAKDWAAYRLRVADFEFRSYRPNSPMSPNFLSALVEYTAVLALDPQNAQALLHRNCLVSNKNVLGLARDADVIPDFGRFENVVTSYGPLITNVFQSANIILGTDATLDQKSQELQVRIASLQDFMQVLAAEQVAAQAGLQAAQAEQTRAAQRLADWQAALEQAAASQPNTLIAGAVFATAAVIGAVAGVITGGAAVLAIVPAVIDITNRLSDDNSLITRLQDDKSRKDFTDAGGGLKDLIEGIIDAITVGKAIADLAGVAPRPQPFNNSSNSSTVNCWPTCMRSKREPKLTRPPPDRSRRRTSCSELKQFRPHSVPIFRFSARPPGLWLEPRRGAWTYLRSTPSWQPDRSRSTRLSIYRAVSGTTSATSIQT